MDTITTIIVWATPAILGLATWAMVELFKDMKEDVKDLKISNSNIRTDIAKQSVQITNLDSKVNSVGKAVDEMQKMTHELDKRTANIQDSNVAIIKLTTRIDQSESNYGKILVILDGIAKRTGIVFKKSGS